MPNLNKLEPPMACSITNAHNDYDEPSEADIKEAELKAAEVYRSRFFENNDLGYVCEMLERVSDENIETLANLFEGAAIGGNDGDITLEILYIFDAIGKSIKKLTDDYAADQDYKL